MSSFATAVGVARRMAWAEEVRRRFEVPDVGDFPYGTFFPSPLSGQHILLPGSVGPPQISVEDLSELSTDLGTQVSGAVLVGLGGIVLTSDSGGGTPSTGIIISGSKIRLRSSGSDVVVLNGTDGSLTADTGTFTGVTILNAVSWSTKLDTSGITIKSNTYPPGVQERLSLQDATGTEVGYLYAWSTGTSIQLSATASGADVRLTASSGHAWVAAYGSGKNAYVQSSGGDAYLKATSAGKLCSVQDSRITALHRVPVAEGGSVNVSMGGTSFAYNSVGWGYKNAAPTTVVATVQGAYNPAYIAEVTNITSTGCDIYCQRRDGAAVSTTIPIRWLAVWC